MKPYKFSTSDMRDALARFGDQIRRSQVEQREALGITQRELADAVKLHPSELAKWELGQKQLDPADVARIQNALRSHAVKVETRKQLGESLAERRKRAGLSQYDLAKLAGVGLRTVARAEATPEKASKSTLAKLQAIIENQERQSISKYQGNALATLHDIGKLGERLGGVNSFFVKAGLAFGRALGVAGRSMPPDIMQQAEKGIETFQEAHPLLSERELCYRIVQLEVDRAILQKFSDSVDRIYQEDIKPTLEELEAKEAKIQELETLVAKLRSLYEVGQEEALAHAKFAELHDELFATRGEKN